jgi:hypothetical protein
VCNSPSGVPVLQHAVDKRDKHRFNGFLPCMNCSSGFVKSFTWQWAFIAVRFDQWLMPQMIWHASLAGCCWSNPDHTARPTRLTSNGHRRKDCKVWLGTAFRPSCVVEGLSPRAVVLNVSVVIPRLGPFWASTRRRHCNRDVLNHWKQRTQ